MSESGKYSREFKRYEIEQLEEKQLRRAERSFIPLLIVSFTTLIIAVATLIVTIVK